MTIKPVEFTPTPGYPDKYAVETKETLAGQALCSGCAAGSINEISPMLCAHERMVLPIADQLAERLYLRGSALFVQKHYNDFYPLASLAEDVL